MHTYLELNKLAAVCPLQSVDTAKWRTCPLLSRKCGRLEAGTSPVALART